jgi:hypothetical protein
MSRSGQKLMIRKISKTVKVLIIGVALLTVTSAPTLQALSFANQFSKSDFGCKCSCCKTEIEESACPVKGRISQDKCPCKVEQQLPFNSRPFESSAPAFSGKDLAVQYDSGIEILIFGINETFEKALFKIPITEHPPLYILNSSFLI